MQEEAAETKGMQWAMTQSLWCSLNIFKWSMMSSRALALCHAVGGAGNKHLPQVACQH